MQNSGDLTHPVHHRAQTGVPPRQDTSPSQGTQTGEPIDWMSVHYWTHTLNPTLQVILQTSDTLCVGLWVETTRPWESMQTPHTTQIEAAFNPSSLWERENSANSWATVSPLFWMLCHKSFKMSVQGNFNFKDNIKNESLYLWTCDFVYLLLHFCLFDIISKGSLEHTKRDKSGKK